MKKKLATVMAATMAVSGSVVSVSAATTEEQLVGSNRTDTAVKISKEGWTKAETVILVNDAAIPDALTATPLAYAKNAPILLTAKGGLTKATANEIKRLGAKDVIMIGGDAVLPAKIENDLKALKVKTDRVKGSTREETALAIAKRLDGIKDVSEIAVVNGTTGLADAVSVAAAAAEKGMPILLANPKSGLSAVEKFIKEESIKSSFIIGGDKAVSNEIAKNLPGKQRIEGANRNDTNAKVIETFYADKNLDNLYLAKDGMENSGQLIDALAVGALAAKNGAPVLIASKKLNSNQVNVVNTKKIATITQVGGKGNEGAFNQLKEIEKAEVIKVKNEAELQEALKKANANDTIEIDANATISKDVTLSTNNAIEINVKGDLTGKVTVKTPNADIKNSGTIGTLVVENGKNTTVTNTSAGKIDKVEVSSSSENVKVENNGTITEVKNDGEGTKVDNEGTISKPITGTETPNVEGNKPGGSTSSGGSSGGVTTTTFTVKDETELDKALKDAKSGDTIYLSGDSYTLTKQINLTKEQNGIILKGNGKTVVTDNNSWAKPSDRSGASIINIVGASNITVEGITVEGAPALEGATGHGINIFNCTNITLKNVVSKNNAGSGVTINDSTVTINGITTEGNPWQGINIDETASNKSSLTLSGSVDLKEPIQVKSDKGDPKVTWNGSKKASIKDVNINVWTDRKSGAIGMKEGESSIYDANLQTAMSKVQEGFAVIVVGANELDSQLEINKSLLITGTEDATISAGEKFKKTNSLKDNLVSVSGVKSISLSNLTITKSLRNGLSIYESGHKNTTCTADCNCYGVKLENIKLSNNAGNGLLVNGSSVEATGIVANGNKWPIHNVGRSIDVTQGVGVTLPSVLKIDSVSKLEDAGKIIADEKCDGNGNLPESTIIKVTIGSEVIIPQHSHNESGDCKFSWTK